MSTKIQLANDKKVVNDEREINIFTNKFFLSIVAIVLGLLTGLLIASFQGFSAVEMMTKWVNTNFGSVVGVGDLLGVMSWVVILGLSLLVSFRAGIFNIGAAGQALAAGVVSLWIGTTVNAAGVGPFIVILASVATGGAIAYLIGILKTKFKIHEVISSIMINWIIFYIWQYTSFDPATILPGNSLQVSWLTNLFNGSTKISIGIFFLLAIPLLWFVYKYTVFGYKQDILGSNPSAAEYIGMKKDKEMHKTFIISGALAGLSGAFIFIGQSQPPNVDTAIELPGLLFEGITVSLLAAYNPLAVLFTSFFIGSFINAGDSMASVTGQVPYSTIIMASSIFWIAIFNIFNYVDIKGKIEAWYNKDNPVEVVKITTTKTTVSKKKTVSKKAGGK